MTRKGKQINRRNFVSQAGRVILGAGAAGGLLSCGPPEQTLPEASAEKQTPSYGSFQMGFQSYSLRHFRELDAFIAEASRLDLSYVELWRGHLSPDSTREKVIEIRGKFEEAGLQTNAFGVENFSADHEANRKLFEFAETLGVRNLSAYPSKDAFESLERLVGEFDIRIAIHNHGPEDEIWRRPEWISQAVGELDPRIGACADLGHFIREGVDPVEAIQVLGKRVLGVHLKDFDADGNDAVLGDGQLDLAGALKALEEIGFEGPLSLEFEGDQEDPVPKMLQCLERVQQVLAA